MRSLADDLTLLLIDRSGRIAVDATRANLAIGGAVLLDLLNAGRVRIEEKRRKQRRIVVTNDTPTGDVVLDDALRKLARKPTKLQAAVEMLSKGARNAVLDRLVERGLLRRQETKRLGIVRTRRWVPTGPEHQAEVVRRIESVLLHGASPDAWSHSLVALLYASGAVTKVVAGDKAQLRSRAKEIAEGSRVGTAVQRAVEDVYHAAIAGVLEAVSAAPETSTTTSC